MSHDAVKNWLEITGRLPVLSDEEVLRLGHIIQNTDTNPKQKKAAVNKLVRHNLRLVAKITISFMSKKIKYAANDDRISDYLQQGALGLIRAAEKYDPARGYKFSTYAHNWIKAHLMRHYYSTYSLVHIPENVLCALIGNNKPALAKSVEFAARFNNLDSLDRILETANSEQVCLGDIIDDQGLVLV